MKFMLCIGFLNGLFFMMGLSIFFSDKVPLAIGVLLMSLSAFVIGMLLGGGD